MSGLCDKIQYLTAIQTVENLLSRAEYFMTHHNYANFQKKTNIMCQCVTVHAAAHLLQIISVTMWGEMWIEKLCKVTDCVLKQLEAWNVC